MEHEGVATKNALSWAIFVKIGTYWQGTKFFGI
jgi:hypothetical protein